MQCFNICSHISIPKILVLLICLSKLKPTLYSNAYYFSFSVPDSAPSPPPSKPTRLNFVQSPAEGTTTKSMVPTTSSQHHDTTTPQILTTTTTAKSAEINNRMKIESSLFDDVKEGGNVAKANIEHEPTQTFKDNDVGNVAALKENYQGRSQFFLSGAPKQPELESALFLSGAPVVRDKDGGALKNAESASSRSNVKPASNGYNWQQYMPFGNYIWEKQNRIPSDKVRTISSPTSTASATSDGSNSLRGNIYGNDNRGMLSGSVDRAGAYQVQGTNGILPMASQRQSTVNVYSTGDRMTEVGIARSEIQRSKNQRKPSDSSQPKKSPVGPNTELGIPQVVASDPNQKATVEPQSMLPKCY